MSMPIQVTTEPQSVAFHLPAIPYTPIDALNRRAAAVGSPEYAQRSAHADYNGKAVRVWWNSFRRYYIAEYTWAGRNVLARGSFASCLRAALRYYEAGALGSSVRIVLREGDRDAEEICRQTPQIREGHEGDLAWLTWRHTMAAQCVRDYANPGGSAYLFDWEIMQSAQSREEYLAAVKAKHGRMFQ